MRWETTPAFEADLGRLSREELARFRQVVRAEFVPAAERRLADPAAPWPAKLRLKTVCGAGGILEMTWSFAGPDSRATFEWTTIRGERGIRWRRVGGHEIFGEAAC